MELTIDADDQAKDAWADVSPTERARLFNKIADRTEENLDLLALAEEGSISTID